MPRLLHKNPKYCHHRSTGQAFVKLDGQQVYLGTYGSAASRQEYDRVIGEWLANGRRVPASIAGGGGVTVVELLNAFRKHAEVYYRDPAGATTSSVTSFKGAVRPLRKLYGRTPAAEFGPLALKAVREEMIRLGWCRTNINRQLGRIRQVFKWGAENEIVPPTVYQGLQAVAALKAGRSVARESEAVAPVPQPVIDATVEHLSPVVRAMVELQLVTGMRPGEVCRMRTGDVDRSGKLWVYVPPKHKTQHHGHARVIYLGPKAQAILSPYLRMDPSLHLFSPADAEAWRLEQRAKARKTPLNQGNRPGVRLSRRPRTLGTAYDVDAYRRAIARACEQAFDMPADLVDAPADETAEAKAARLKRARAWRAGHTWHPHQLRHNAATWLRKTYGLEAAQVILGHKTLAVTEVYAAKNVEAAQRIMAEVG
jgi:integrase